MRLPAATECRGRSSPEWLGQYSLQSVWRVRLPGVRSKTGLWDRTVQREAGRSEDTCWSVGLIHSRTELPSTLLTEVGGKYLHQRIIDGVFRSQQSGMNSKSECAESTGLPLYSLRYFWSARLPIQNLSK